MASDPINQQIVRFQDLINHCRTSALLVDAQEPFHVLLCNPSARTLFCLPEDDGDCSIVEHLRALVVQFLPANQHSERLKTLSELERHIQENTSWTGELRLPSASGDRLVALTCAPLPIHNDGDAQVAIYGEDLTELRRLERMRDDFISALSHELRTSLTSIQGSLSLIWNGVPVRAPEELRSLARMGLNNAQRLNRLVEDILDVEKLGQGRLSLSFDPVSSDKLVELAMSEAIQSAQAKGIRLHHQSDSGPVKVFVDTHRFVQALVNLLQNAIKHSPAGSDVYIQTSNDDQNQRATFRIIDSGPGIDDEAKQIIFEPYIQRDTSQALVTSGSGLGLAIALRLVRQFHGDIKVEDNPSGGSIFVLTLPSFQGSLSDLLESMRKNQK